MEIVQGTEPTPAAEPATPEPAAAAPAPAPDFDAIAAKFAEGIAPQFEALKERLPAEPEPVTDPSDPRYFTPDDLDPVTGQPTDAAQERAFWDAVDVRAREIATQVAQDAVAPITAASREQQIAQEVDALEAKYPELATDTAVVERVLDAAATRAAQMGLAPDAAAALAQSPQFLEVTYLATKAQEGQASATAPGATPSVPIEQGGAAGPAAPTDDAPDAGDRIVQLAQSSRFRLGS